MRNWDDEKIKEWHINTFPDIKPEQQLEHAQDEIFEFEQEYRNMFNGANNESEYFEEMADVYIVSIGLSRFYPGISRRIISSLPQSQLLILYNYIDKKMSINLKRKYYKKNDKYTRDKEND